MSDYDLINGEIINVTITVDEETVTGIINTAARGPAGPAGSALIDSATVSDGTADLDLLNVTTATATVSGTLTADHIHGNLAGSVYAHIRAGEALTKGDPVYVSGFHPGSSTAEVMKADASNAAKMPAIGIMDANVAHNNTGHMVIVGNVIDIDTSTFSVNAELYVKAGGGLTGTPPTARAQPVARVERVNLNNGAIIVKVNGLSASDATANTLVRRTANGDASFGALTTSGLTVTGGTTFGGDSLLQFDAIEYYYGTGAASAHRIALGGVGDSSTGTALFGAATEAEARKTIGTAVRTRAVIVDADFYNSTDTAGLSFASFNSGTAAQSATTSTSNHPGVIRMASGASINSGVRLRHDSSAMVLGGGELCEWVFQIQSLSNGVGAYIGFHDTNTQAAPTNGVWVQFDANGTTLTCSGKTNAGSTPTTTGTTYSASINTWYSLTVEMNANASVATFALRSEAGAVLWTNTLSSNIPTGASQRCSLAFNAFNVNNSAVALTLIDYVRMEINRTLTR